MKRTARNPRPVRARDPLFNSSVQKALAMLETVGGERRALSLAELATGAGMTTSSAPLARDPQISNVEASKETGAISRNTSEGSNSR